MSLQLMKKAQKSIYYRVKDLAIDSLEPREGQSLVGRLLSWFIISLILLNVFVVILETVPHLYADYFDLFYLVEIIIVLIFTVEYVVRVWMSNALPGFEGRFIGRLKFILTPMAFIDLLAIVPFYLQLLFLYDRKIAALMLVLRMLRVLKITRYFESVNMIIEVIRIERDAVVATLIGGGMLLVIFSSLMFWAEHDAQPDVFVSIPASMWWGIVTMTTVGYGEIYPITPVGKVIGGIVALLGVGMFVLPAGILAAGFEEQIHARRRKPRPCPHCGKDVNRPPKHSSPE